MNGLSFFALTLIQPTCLGVEMATPVRIASSNSTSKRARSQDSQCPSNNFPASGTTGICQASCSPNIPTFLRQSRSDIRAKFESLELEQQLRLEAGRKNPASKWAQDMSTQVKLRNRYVNVQPWEQTRIHLKVAEGKSDYINASPISLQDPSSGAETTFIAAQGPKHSGISHFWHMIWQETKDVAVVVMLTQTAEAGKEKCCQYFPLSTNTKPYQVDPFDGSEESFKGNVTLVEVVEDPVSRTTIRKLVLSCDNESRTIWHLLFSGWPDFAVPEGDDRHGLLELLKLSVEKNSVRSNPRIIHCSAGVGRSGTFIALDYLLNQIKTGAMAKVQDDLDLIYDVVNNLRQQRMTMVQSEAQYQFLYQVIREEFEKWQVALNKGEDTGEPSPKLRRLDGGIKSNLNEAGPSGETTTNQGKAPTTSSDDLRFGRV